MSPKQEFIIDFQITGRCNLNCPFCCGAIKSLSEVRTESLKIAIDKLVAVGATTVVFTGGEPLLRKDIIEIIKHAYQKGLKIYLSTNGVSLLDHWQKIRLYLNCLGLPLDGSSSLRSKKMGRGRESYKAVITILKFFKNNPPRSLIKVGTVVSKINKDDLIRIGTLLFKNSELYHPDVWRLYQFSPLNYGTSVKWQHKITDKEFIELVQEVQTIFPGKKIIPLSNTESNNSYIFISPNLKIILLTNEKFVEIGDMQNFSTRALREVLRKRQKTIESGSHNRGWLFNIRRTY